MSAAAAPSRDNGTAAALSSGGTLAANGDTTPSQVSGRYTQLRGSCTEDGGHENAFPAVILLGCRWANENLTNGIGPHRIFLLVFICPVEYYLSGRVLVER